MVTIVPRSAWGARYPDGGGSAPLPAREVWLHHSVTIAPDLIPPFTDDDAAMRTLESIGQSRFGQGISYTFAVTPVGRVHQGHSVNRLGAHTGGRNSIARAICWIGNYDVNAPTSQMIEATAQLLVDGKRAGWWTAARLNGGHQQAPGASTACPGRHAMAVIGPINARAAAIEAGAPQPGKPVTQEDDMRLIQAPGRGTAVVGPGYFRSLNAEEAANAPAICGPAVVGNDRQFDLWRSMALSGETTSPNLGQLNDAVAKLSGIAGADVDEVALAAALAEHIDGVNTDQIAEAFRKLLRDGVGA